jgi:hypothetical protein
MTRDGVKIGALWETTDSKGVTYLKGRLGDAYLLVYPTKDGGGGPRRRPQYLVYIVPPAQKQDDDGRED